MGKLACANRVGQYVASATFGIALLTLVGCGGGGAPMPGGGGGSGSTYTVGGTVTGLSSNDSVTVLMNVANPLTVSANGVFAFTETQRAGTAYAVTVQSHTPGRTCAVTHGSGTLASANVNDVEVTCRAANYSVLSDLSFENSGIYPSSSLIMDGSGNLFGTTSEGGLSNSGTVFKLSRNSNGNGYTGTTLYNFTGGADGAMPQAALLMDNAGNLFGTTSSGGSNNNGTAFKLSPGPGGYVKSILYNFASGNDGASPYAPLIMDSIGNLFGTTRLGGRNNVGTVFKLSPNSSGYTKSTVYEFDFGSAGQRPLAGLIMDNAGNLYGATSDGESSSGAVFKLTPSGGSYLETTLYEFDGGSNGGSPQASLLMDSAGNIFGTTKNGGTSGRGTVFKLHPNGSGYQITTLYKFTGGADGANPTAALIIDSTGNVYGTSSAGVDFPGAVFRLTPSGSTYIETTLHTFAGASNGANPFSALIMDNAGNLYGTTEFGGSVQNAGTVFKLGN